MTPWLEEAGEAVMNRERQQAHHAEALTEVPKYLSSLKRKKHTTLLMLPRPVRYEDTDRISVAESTGDKKEGLQRSWSSRILRRPRSSSSIGNQSVSPANAEGTRTWSRYASRNVSAASIVSIAQAQGQNVIEAAARLIGGRRRRASESAPSTPFAPDPLPADPSVTARAAADTPHPPINSPHEPQRPKILFYYNHEPHYGFTNFSPHPVRYEEKSYPTSEHLFQSLKFAHHPSLSEHIRICSLRPSVAFVEASRFAPEVRKDWTSYQIKAMELAISLKFSQHKDLKRELLATGDAELIENSDQESFWGCGPEGKGRNELGKALERLREELRQENIFAPARIRRQPSAQIH